MHSGRATIVAPEPAPPKCKSRPYQRPTTNSIIIQAVQDGRLSVHASRMPLSKPLSNMAIGVIFSNIPKNLHLQPGRKGGWSHEAQNMLIQALKKPKRGQVKPVLSIEDKKDSGTEDAEGGQTAWTQTSRSASDPFLPLANMSGHLMDRAHLAEAVSGPRAPEDNLSLQDSANGVNRKVKFVAVLFDAHIGVAKCGSGTSLGRLAMSGQLGDLPPSIRFQSPLPGTNGPHCVEPGRRLPTSTCFPTARNITLRRGARICSSVPTGSLECQGGIAVPPRPNSRPPQRRAYGRHHVYQQPSAGVRRTQ